MKQSGKFSELINSSTPVLVDFSATWCGPCKMMIPILEALKSNLGPLVKIIKIDVDKNPDFANQFQVRGVPTLIVFQNGEIKWRQSGVQQVAQLRKVLEPYLNR